jgi:hypothetical protein
MAWESRDGTGHRYYTRSRRVNGRVVREYVGSGRRGAAAAQHDAERRARQDDERLAREAERARLQAIDAQVEAWDEQVKPVIQGLLLLAGYHQHQRGEWRKRRVPRPPAE